MDEKELKSQSSFKDRKQQLLPAEGGCSDNRIFFLFPNQIRDDILAGNLTAP